jgi:Tfp pilus assembly protein PilX
MNSKRTIHPSREQGQTLVIAVIILGILLILGTAFAGIVSRNITEAGRAAQRTVGTDLAEAGARLAHTQLLNSELGADWRPALTPRPRRALPAPGHGDPLERHDGRQRWPRWPGCL